MTTHKCPKCNGTGVIRDGVGREMLDLRKKKGISQRRMAQLLEIDTAQLSRMENDKPNHPWSDERIKRYKAMLRVA